MLSASRWQPHLLHVSAADRRQIWSMDKSWQCVTLSGFLHSHIVRCRWNPISCSAHYSRCVVLEADGTEGSSEEHYQGCEEFGPVPWRGVARSKNVRWTTGGAFKGKSGGGVLSGVQGLRSGGGAVKLPESVSFWCLYIHRKWAN